MPAVPRKYGARAEIIDHHERVGAMSFGRWAAVALGLGLVVGGVALGAGPYHDLQAFERAGHCATSSPGTARDCVATARVSVVSRSTYTTPDNDTGPDPNWPPPPQPPIPQPPMGPPLRAARTVVNTARQVSAATETTHYRVTVRTDDGRRHTYTVTAGLYETATPGTVARADLWHGRITRLTIGAETVEIPPDSGFDHAWLMGWAGVMLLVWSVPGRVHLGIVLWLWWTGNVVYHMLGSWDPAWYMVPLLIAGSLLAWKAREMILGRRRRLRYARLG